MSTVSLQLSDQDVARIAAAVAERLKRPAETLLTAAQASAVTGLSLKALERRRSRGQAPHSVKRSGRVNYLQSEIEAYVAGTARRISS